MPRLSARPIAGASTLAFVASLAARHGLERQVPGAERVLRAGLRASIVMRLAQSFALRLSPAVHVHLPASLRPAMRGTEAPAAVAHEAPAAPAWPSRTLRERSVVTRLLERTSRVSCLDARAAERIERTIERIHRTRLEREEARAPAALAVRRTLAHGPQAALAAARAGASAAPATPVPASPRPFSAVPAKPSTLPVDVAHLTREVMRTIDERIVAHRERLGRT